MSNSHTCPALCVLLLVSTQSGVAISLGGEQVVVFESLVTFEDNIGEVR